MPNGRSADRHPVRGLKRFAAGRATAVQRRAVVRHLLGGCRRCGARLADLLRPRPADPAALSRVVERAVAGFDRLELRVGAELTAAEELIDRLRDLPEARQRLMVANTERARQRAVCEELISESRAHRHDSAAETLRYAELAVLAAERYTGPDADELRARALAERGNARRIAGDLRAAEKDFAVAQRLLRAGSADPLVEAQLLSLRASLADDLRRFDVAIQLLKKATAQFDRFDDMPGLARTLIKLGRVHGRRGEPREGIAWMLQALKLPAIHQDPALKMIALHNLIYLVMEAGDPAEAATLLAYVRPVVLANASPLDRLRFDWLSARIDRDLGNAPVAARMLERLRASYLHENLPYEVALVSLDLAVVYVQLDRRSALNELAAETTELLGRLGVRREQIAALRLLVQAEADDAVRLAAGLTAAVEQARGVTASLPAPVA
jgi:tetratricopeptide (TPR) repeat protein